MKTGVVKWFNNAKGYGFILSDDESKYVFAHYSSIEMDGYRRKGVGEGVVELTGQSTPLFAHRQSFPGDHVLGERLSLLPLRRHQSVDDQPHEEEQPGSAQHQGAEEGNVGPGLLERAGDEGTVHYESPQGEQETYSR